jgi:phosphoglycolate phosphatase
MLKEIKLIIFDLDGTLVDAYPAIIKSFNYVMQKLNYPTQDNLTIRRAVGWGDKNLFKPFIKAKDLSVAVSLYRRHHKTALIHHSRLFAKVNRVLAYLKGKGYKLAVASNRPTEFSWILIRHLKLARYFDYVLCADKLRHIKPHPEILNKIRQRFSLSVKQVLYVGDMVIDVQAGRRARIKMIAVSTGSNSGQELKEEKPYRVIPKITDLLAVL